MANLQRIYSKRILDPIKADLKDIMLRTSLWGVLDILTFKRRYEIIAAVNEIAESQEFKDDGFSLRLIDGDNFVQKIPFFNDNEEFISKNKLTLSGRPNYPTYLLFMQKHKK